MCFSIMFILGFTVLITVIFGMFIIPNVGSNGDTRLKRKRLVVPQIW